METLKDAGRFALGCVFVVSLIPPFLIIFAFAVIGGHIDRETP